MGPPTIPVRFTRLYFYASGGVAFVPLGGGDATPVLKFRSAGGDGQFAVSHDGQWLAFGDGVSTDRRIWRVSAQGGEPVIVSKGTGNAPYWSPDDKWIFFTSIRNSDGGYQVERTGTNIWRVSADGRNERPLTNFAGRRGYLGTNIATDGHSVYFTWREDVSDIWMMDVER